MGEQKSPISSGESVQRSKHHKGRNSGVADELEKKTRCGKAFFAIVIATSYKGLREALHSISSPSYPAKD